MTREQLDDLEKLLSTATPAPWWAQREYDSGRTVCQMRHPFERVCINKAAHVEGNPWDAHWANANLIQDLRNNAAGLIAQAREALELREALEWFSSCLDDSTLIETNGVYRVQGYVWVREQDQSYTTFLSGEGSTPLEAINNARRGK